MSTRRRQKVVISAPSQGRRRRRSFGVNDVTYAGVRPSISNASCTTNCLAPLARLLHDTLGIKRGLMTTVHADTSDAEDRRTAHPTRTGAAGAASLENIIPTIDRRRQGAVGLVLPELNEQARPACRSACRPSTSRWSTSPSTASTATSRRDQRHHEGSQPTAP
jgi:glyceraldehyde-3-phosphate dehydrogenase/erythrose-4-phosphate dehydrogenase